jgi:guanine deaminase
MPSRRALPSPRRRQQMEMARALVAEHPELPRADAPERKHAEIAYSMELYPGAKDYTGIYEHYGLLGPKTLLGHSIHLNHRETGSDGQCRGGGGVLPDLEPLPRFGAVRPRPAGEAMGCAWGSPPISAGARAFHAADYGRGLQGAAIARAAAQSAGFVPPGDARQCRGAGAGREPSAAIERRGGCRPIVVLDARATPTMRMRMATVETLVEELFLLQTLGDDRAIAEVYVAGARAKSTLGGL